MADTKISALPGATTPLAGTEVVPLVQSSTTKNVSVANLTAGRAVNAASLTTTGDIVSNTNAFKVDSSNKYIGVGTASPTTQGSFLASNGANINVQSRAYFGGTYSSNSLVLGYSVKADPAAVDQMIGTETNSGGGAPAAILMNSGAIQFHTASSITTGAAFSSQRMGISSGGDVTVNTGNLVIGTSGKGIDFSANSHAAGMTSETLTWYEEGTWTPTLTAQTVGDLSVTYAIRVGTYTRVGRLCTISWRITTSAFSHSTAANDLYITGIPFSARTLTNMRTTGSMFIYGGNKTGYTQVNAQIDSASSSVFAIATGIAGSSISSVKITEVTSGGTPFISGTLSYEV